MAESVGIVLAGGRSSRMGTPKAALEWHGSTLLRRVVGIVGRAVDGPVIVVRAPDQELPSLPADVEIAEDAREGRGPLQGLAVRPRRGARPRARRVCLVDRRPAAAPAVRPSRRGRRGRWHRRGAPADPRVPAAARRGLPDRAGRGRRAAHRRRPDAPRVPLRCLSLRRGWTRTRCSLDPALAALDPELDSVLNLNEPADYDAARARPAPEVIVRVFGALRRAAGASGDPALVPAATLAEAAAAIGLALDGHVVAALNGDQIVRDGETPLVAGDAVSFLAADAGG